MSDDKFYSDAAAYWAGVEPTVAGVLGGFECLSEPDAAFSGRFLDELMRETSLGGARLALDCGAGVGRVASLVLAPRFERVDLVEPNAAFLERARDLIDAAKLGRLYAVGLQEFEPTRRYDVVWCQWVLGHLTDGHLVDFFARCRDSLSANGVIVVKENVTSSNKIEKDEVDSSITRPLAGLLTIFKRAKLKIIKERKQTDFPKGLYPVYAFALRPKRKRNVEEAQRTPKISSEPITTTLNVKNSETDGLIEKLSTIDIRET